MVRVRRKRWAVRGVLAGAVLALAPAVASAELTVQSVTLPGDLDSIAAPPGSVVFGATVRVAASGGDTWRVVRYRFEPASGGGAATSGCIALSRANGSATVTLPTQNPSSTTNPAQAIVLPRAADVYALEVWVTSATSCSGTAAVESPRRRIADAVRVTTGIANPNLGAGCGLNVMLVLDASGSIRSTAGATAAVRDAASGFLEALSGTGSHLSIVDFARTARWPIAYTAVTPASIREVFSPYVDGTGSGDRYDPASGGTTNWEAALAQVNRIDGQATAPDPPAGARVADLVVFVTDGDPNTYGTGSSPTYLQNREGDLTPMARAQTAAGDVKTDGAHIFAIGVGNAMGNGDSESRLTAVSGPTEYASDPDNFDRADYVLVSRFSQLRAALRRIAVSLCAPSLIVTKLVDAQDGDGYQPQPGWDFTTSLAVDPGGYDWRIPAGAPDPGPRTAATDGDGIARFQWGLESRDAQSAVAVAEQDPPGGYEHVGAACWTTTPDGSGRRDEAESLAPAPIPGATVGPDEFRVCAVRNRRLGGHLTVVKHTLPASDTGRFDLLVDGDARVESVGDGGSTGRISVAPGTHAVAERVTAAQADADPPVTLSQYETSTTCLDATGAVVAAGSGAGGGEAVQVSVPNASSDVVCTIVNRRIGAPPPPDTPVPPAEVPPICDYDSANPDCAPIARAAASPRRLLPLARLRIVKRLPATAHRGQTVPVTIVVRNVSRVMARGVLLRDAPPGASVLRASGSGVRHGRDGTVRWRLGRLRPGASRTIHARMTIRDGARGRLRNGAAVSAANANAVFANDVVRVAPLQRVSPFSVTG